MFLSGKMNWKTILAAAVLLTAHAPAAETRPVIQAELLGVAAATLLVLRNLVYSSHGRAIQAVRDDERAAELLRKKREGKASA
jgi:ABC-type branched-subunit amino acid transport system permease subunit